MHTGILHASNHAPKRAAQNASTFSEEGGAEVGVIFWPMRSQSQAKRAPFCTHETDGQKWYVVISSQWNDRLTIRRCVGLLRIETKSSTKPQSKGASMERKNL